MEGSIYREANFTGFPWTIDSFGNGHEGLDDLEPHETHWIVGPTLTEVSWRHSHDFSVNFSKETSRSRRSIIFLIRLWCKKVLFYPNFLTNQGVYIHVTELCIWLYHPQRPSLPPGLPGFTASAEMSQASDGIRFTEVER